MAGTDAAGLGAGALAGHILVPYQGTPSDAVSASFGEAIKGVGLEACRLAAH